MTYREQVRELVNAQVGTGKTLAEIIEPLLNMTVSSMAAVCQQEGLDLESELEAIHATVDDFAKVYKKKYDEEQITH